MGIKDTWAIKQLVMATQELHASRLYERYDDSDYFLIHTPRLDDPALAVIMGNGGETFGLSLYLGPGARASYEGLFYARDESQARMAMMKSQMLGYCMVAGGELSFEARKWLKKAKVKPERGRQYPDPMYIKPGKVPVVALKDKQTQLLLHLTRGILAATQDKSFDPCGIDRRGRVLAVTLTREGENPQATISWEQAEPGSAGGTATRSGPGEELRVEDLGVRPAFDLNGLKPNGDSWLVSMVPAPGYVQDDDRQPFMLLVCSEQAGGMWPCLVMGAEGQEVVDQLAALMRGEPDIPDNRQGRPGVDLTPPPPGLPDAILADSASLHRVLDRAFAPLGIDCVKSEEEPAMQAMFDEFRHVLDMSVGDGDFDAALIEQLGDKPEDDDIDGWKGVDSYIKDLVHTGFENDSRYYGRRALKRYFGSDADADQLMDDYQHLMAIDSYAMWFATRYHSSRKRPTLAENWLDDPDTPRPVKHLLRAILGQAPSIYRLGEVDEDAGKIEYEDLFTGQITIVTDYNLSTCVQPGMILPGLLVPAGDFYLFYPAGPLMRGHQFSTVIDYLDDQRITDDPAKAFREQPHLMGNLWHVVDRAQKQKPVLCNTDGHALTPTTAVFACPDRGDVERFLEQHEYYEREDEDTWNWFREGVPAPRFEGGDDAASATRVCDTSHETNQGPITLLGQVTLGNGKLTLTVNSGERMSAARALLELIDGVTLHSVESKTADAYFHEAEQRDANPIDTFDLLDDAGDDSPAWVDEDHALAASAYIAEHYRRWLDSPVPMLDDLTPRHAAQNPKYRKKVTALIRSIPDPNGLGDSNIRITSPREQLLKELGLA